MRPSALLRNPLLMQRVGQLGEYLRFDGALREGRRPLDMDADEALTHDFCTELLAHHGVGDATYARAVARFGERGVVDLTALVGDFTMVSWVLNVAHTPPEPAPGIAPLPPLPR
jgi:4-carboxymuconolactone decarboxylase